MSFLQIDKTRPAYVENPRDVWLRRRPWYLECSNHQYYGIRAGQVDVARPLEGLGRFLNTITGQGQALSAISVKKQSYFVSLTLPDVAAEAPILEEVTVGSDAVELRVDLLEDPQRKGKPPSADFVASQIAVLRCSSDLPIIFTVRTQSQGGQMPDGAYEDIQELLNLALRMGIEFLDLEITLPEEILRSVSESKRNTKIIASHHDPRDILSWSNGSWVPHYNKALLYGDIIKLVGIAKSQSSNFSLLQFRSWALTAHPSVPIIAINMGIEGQLSRIQNPFLSPVWHPALPFKAAPGQLSASEIRTALSLHGVITPKQFYLLGKPISQSKSPAMHNYLFRKTGLSHQYRLHETDDSSTLESIIRKPDFGGASVTIPLKLPIIDLLDEVSPAAKTIGAVNTIVVEHSHSSLTHAGKPYLVGHNTDWTGMRLILSNAGAATLSHSPPSPSERESKKSALVIGGGGTARAAIYTLNQMGYNPIHLLGRSREKLQTVVESFPEAEYNINIITTHQDAVNVTENDSSPPIAVAIGTIPADKPIDSNVEELLDILFTAHASIDAETTKQRGGDKKILLEMAYKPAVTPLMTMAEKRGWVTIKGLEVLAGQGVGQFELWTGIKPLLRDARVSWCSLFSSYGIEGTSLIELS
ncbi:MAG: hypothetical protein Q9198_008702 [Flavoplaca austrocitrina]